MQTFKVDGLTFDVPDGWPTGKYDEWSFYRNRWIRMKPDAKAVDLVVCDDSGITWLVEVKDYRRHQRTKVIDLADEVAQKVCDTLAALLPARVNGDDAVETAVARAALSAGKLRVVLHLEQPAKHSKLFPRAIDPASVQQRLRRRVRAIDAHAVVVETSRPGHVPWSVR